MWRGKMYRMMANLKYVSTQGFVFKAKVSLRNYRINPLFYTWLKFGQPNLKLNEKIIYISANVLFWDKSSYGESFCEAE